MKKHNKKGAVVLFTAAVALLLVGCVYGNPDYYGRGGYDGYYGYNDYYDYSDPYYGNAPVVDPGAALLGPAIAGIEHLLIGPIVGSIMGGTLGYGYDQPYYHDRYYNDRYRYDDRYYDDDYYRYPYGYPR